MAVPAQRPQRGVLGLQEAGLRLGPIYVFTRPLWAPLLPQMGVKGVIGPVAVQFQGFLWIGDALVEALLPPVEDFQLDLHGWSGAVGVDLGTGVFTYRLFSSTQGTGHLLVLAARFPWHLYLETALGTEGLGPVALSWHQGGSRGYWKLGLLFSRAHLLGLRLPVLPLLDLGLAF